MEVIAELPKGSRLALQTAKWVGRALQPVPERWEEFGDAVTDPGYPRRVRIPLGTRCVHKLGRIVLPPNTAVPSHLLVNIPHEEHVRPFDVAIRQLYNGREVGRITWRLIAERKGQEQK